MHHHPFSGVSQTNMHRQNKYKSSCQNHFCKTFVNVSKTILSHDGCSHKWSTCVACIIIIAACFLSVNRLEHTSNKHWRLPDSDQSAATRQVRAGILYHCIQPFFLFYRFPPVWQAAVSHTTSLSDFRLILSFCFSMAFSSSVTFFTSCDRPGTGNFLLDGEITVQCSAPPPSPIIEWKPS